MPHHKAQKKSLKTDARKYEANKSAKSRCRTLEKRFREATTSGDKAKIDEAFRTVQKALDQAVSSNIYKKGTIARKKSRLMKAYNQAAT
jgi:small subunit ribosomal protein S20